MAGILAAVGSLILGISLIQLANGYVGTLIGIRLAAAHVEPIVAGIVTSAYFAGYAAGAILCNRLIGRTGHIRAFAAFAGLVTVAFLGHPLYFDPLLWALLRAFAGFGCAGLFVATESWLNAKASALAAILFSIALVVVTMTGAAQPVLVPSSHLKAGELLAAAMNWPPAKVA
jgi:MFS family permease